MIGYYVHHVGRGHLHRAQQVAAALGLPVTGLSSCPRPPGWPGGWVRLPRDDEGCDPRDVTAGGSLHWVPAHDTGLRRRSAMVSAWIEEARPRLVVVDVSVEVTLLVRLHGVPVVSVVLPGDRGDGPHRAAFAASTALVAAWPAQAWAMVSGLTEHDRSRLQCVGGMSRSPVTTAAAPGGAARRGRRRAVVMGGAGGAWRERVDWRVVGSHTPGWEWVLLGVDKTTWVEDPFPLLCSADVVVTHAGQNAVAEVAAARRPAVIVPAERPHDEQRSTATVLRGVSWPALVEQRFPSGGWLGRLEEAASYDGSAWAAWNDGGAAARFAAVVRRHLGEVTA